ncbi:MAG: hypothetical protein VXZ40_04375 [Nanoarchaeota archaeon]|nr:hypothetical protein [Nanoarchaeota archaeon]
MDIEIIDVVLGGLTLGTFAYFANKIRSDFRKASEEDESYRKIDERSHIALDKLLEEAKLKSEVRSLAKILVNSNSAKLIEEPIKVDGRVDYHFQVNDKKYVHSEPNPDSNYLFKPDLCRKPIKCPLERELVNFAYRKLLRTN